MIPLRSILLVFAAGAAPWACGVEPAASTPDSAKAPVEAVAEEPEFLRFVEEEDRDSLQTSIVTYKSAAGVIVDLVGAVHIADEAYFDELNERFKTYDAVLYELVGRPMQLRENLKPGDGDGKLLWLGQVQETLRKALKLESQLKGIDYKAPNFVHADMTVEGFFESQETKKETFLTLWLKAIQAQGALPNDRPQPNMLELVMILRQEDPSMDLKRMLGQQFDSMEKLITGIEANGGTTIIGERNRHALEVMAHEITAGKNRLAIFYGAAHMPDMEQRLLKLGFVKQKVQWLKAWDIPWEEE
jgi:hypothetical protein